MKLCIRKALYTTYKCVLVRTRLLSNKSILVFYTFNVNVNKVVDFSSSDFQMMVLLLYIFILLALYLAPLTFTCPCVMDRHSLRPRPDIIGRRGAPMVSRPVLETEVIEKNLTISE